MKLCKRLILFLLVALMLPVTAYAAGSIDKDLAVSLTISYQDGKHAPRRCRVRAFIK